MPNFNNYKVVIGSANKSPEDNPIKGSNGTMVATRINNFIDAVAVEFASVLPTSKGQLKTVDTGGSPINLAPGANGLVITADSTVAAGLKYSERVDLTSAQTIAGAKTFSSPLQINNTLGVTGLLSGDSLSLTDGITVEGTVDIGDELRVDGPTTLAQLTVNGNLNINSDVTLSSGLNVGDDLIVAGDTELGGVLNVGGPGNFDGNLTVTGNLTASNIYNKAQVDDLVTAQTITNPNLAALSAMTSTGIMVRSSNINNTYINRSIEVTAPLAITNATAVSGNPTITILSADETTRGSIQLATSAEIITGTVSDKAISPLRLAEHLKSPPAIGNTTANAGTFTNLTVNTLATFKGMAYAVNAISASYTITANDYIIEVANTSVARTINLPTVASSPVGKTYIIVDSSGGANLNNITVDAAGSELINDSLTKVITTSYGVMRLFCNGSKWIQI